MVKIDFMKVFDCVDWDFLPDLLKSRGFGTNWCKWISVILHTSKCNILVNGHHLKTIYCKRGFKQGDPLSPMLFIFAADGLNKCFPLQLNMALLLVSNLRGQLNSISSLQFGDNTLIFCKANRRDVTNFKAILYLSKAVYGLSINYAKSSLIYFEKYPNKSLVLSY